MVVWAALLAVVHLHAQQSRWRFSSRFRFDQGSPGEHILRHRHFRAERAARRTSKSMLNTDLNNNWAYFSISL